MSSVDKRIVDMQFNNKQFEAGIKETSNSLKKFDENLSADRSGISRNLDFLADKFTVLGTIGRRAIENITDSVMGLGKNLVNQFVFQPKTEGFGEYETKMGAIQTIMASTGEPLENINKQLDQLNIYADKTKYVFSDMTKNIGKFTNAGIKLEPAVNAIKGISNLAALSGANAEQASHAMYNFAQSLSQGYVGLIDWKSINVAGMDTKEFKQELLDMALEMGTVIKVGEKYKTVTTNAKGETSELFDAVTGWNQALQFQWITSDVLTDTLNRYADTTTEIGQKATEAATKIYKFTEMMGALKETVGSGWAKTWELMLGDFNEAANLWTKIYKFFNDIFEDQSNARNSIIEAWKKSWGGTTQMQAIVQNVLDGIKGIIEQFREAWRSVFPPKTAMELNNIAGSIQQATYGFKKWTTESDTLKRVLTIVFKILKVGVSIFKIAWSVVKGIIEVLKPIGSLLLRIFEIIDGFLSGIFGSFSDDKSVDTVTKITNGITKAFDFLAKNLRKAVDWILEAMADSSTAVEFGKNMLSNIKGFFGKIGSAISTGFTEMGGLSGIGAKISEIWKDAVNAVKGGFGSFVDWIKNFASNLKESNIGTLLDALNFGAILIVASNIKKGLAMLKDGIKSFKKLSEHLEGILKGVKKVLFGFAKKLQAEANDLNATALLKVAGALAIFVGALIALTFIEKEKLNDALSVISILGLVLMGLITALNKGNTIPAALKKVTGGLGSMMKSIGNLAMATALTTFAIGLLALLGVIKLYSSMDLETFISGIAKLGIAFFVIQTVMTSMAKNITGDAKQIRALSKVFTTLSIAALILSAALKILSGVPWETIGKFGALFLGITLVFVAGVRMLQNVKTKTIETVTKGIRRLAFSFMFISAATLLLIPALTAFTILAKLGGWDGFKLMAATIGVLTVAMIGLGVAVRIMGGNAKYFTKIALGIGLLVAAVVAIALVAPIIISSGDKIKDALIILVTAICDTLVSTADKIVAALFAVLNAVLGNLENNIPKIADSLLKIILGILDAVAKYTPELVEAVYNIVKKIVEVLKQKIGEAPIDPKALMISVLSLMGLIKVINMMAKAKSSIKDAKKVLPLMLILLAAVAGVFGLMAVMGVDGSTVRDQAIAVGVVMAALAVSMSQLSKVSRGANTKRLLPMILTLVLMIGAVFAIIGAFQSMKNIDGDKMLEQGLAIALVMLSVSYIVKNASKISGWKQGVGILAALGSIALIIGAIALLFNQMKDLDSSNMIGQAFSLGLIIVALGFAVKMMNNSDIGIKNGVAIGIQLIALGAVMSIATANFTWLKDLDGDKMVKQAVALGLILVAIGFAIKTMNKSIITGRMTFKAAAGIAVQMIALSAALVAAGFALSLIQDADPKNMIVDAIALSLLLLAMTDCAKKLSTTPNTTFKDAVSKAGLMLDIMLALVGAGGAVIALSHWVKEGTDPILLIVSSLALSVILDAMALAAKILASTPKTTFKDAISKAGLIADVCLALFASAGAIAFLSHFVKAGIDPLILAEQAGLLCLVVDNLCLIAAAFNALTKNGVSDPVGKAKLLGEMCLALFASAGAIALMSHYVKANISSEKLKTEALVLCGVLDNLILAATVLNKLNGTVKDPVGKLELLGEMMLAMLGTDGAIILLANFAPGEDLNKKAWVLCAALDNLVGIGIILNRFTGQVEDMTGKLKILGTVIGTALASDGVLILLDNFTGDGDELIKKAKAFSTVMREVDILVGIITGMSLLKVNPAAAAKATLAVEAVVGLLAAGGALLGGIDELTGGKFSEFVSGGLDILVDVFTKVGDAIGGLLGGLAGSLVGQYQASEEKAISKAMPEIGKNLAEFADKAAPALKKFKNTPESIATDLENVGNAVVKFSNVIKMVSVFDDPSATIEHMGNLLGWVKMVVDKTQEVDTAKLNSITELIKSIDNFCKTLAEQTMTAALNALTLPIHNYKNVFDAVGNGINDFYEQAKNINNSDIDNVKNATGVITEITKSLKLMIDVEGGVSSIMHVADGLPELGKGINDYYSSVKDLQSTDIEESITIATMLFDLYKDINRIDTKDKSVLDAVGETLNLKNKNVNLSEMGENIKAFGFALKSFSDNTTDLSSEKVKQGIDNLDYAIECAKKINEITANNYTPFTTAFADLADAGLTGFTRVFIESRDKINDAIGVLYNNTKDALNTKADSLSEDGADAASDLMGSMFGDLDLSGTMFDDGLSEYILPDELNNGMMSSELTDKMTDSIAGMDIDDIESTMGDMFSNIDLGDVTEGLGKDFVDGYIGGIKEKIPFAEKISGLLGSNALDILRKTQNSNSPSKETMGYGRDFVEGYAIGIRNFAYLAFSGVKSVGNECLEIISSVFDDIENREWKPSISPVIDTNSIEEGLGWMNKNLDNSIFGSTMSPAIAKAMNISTTLDESKTNAHLASEIDNLGNRIDNIPDGMQGIIGELANLRDDINEMAENMANLKVVMNNGALVGQISKGMDKALGKTVSRAIRR